MSCLGISQEGTPPGDSDASWGHAVVIQSRELSERGPCGGEALTPSPKGEALQCVPPVLINSHTQIGYFVISLGCTWQDLGIFLNGTVG
jgi:hypothetical protein